MTIKNQKSSDILAPISLGELIDKITILEIKKEFMHDKQLTNVNKELKRLTSIVENQNLDINENLINKLRSINSKLWEIEDNIRSKERKKEFDQEFIELARSVYIQNDIRASIKKEINQLYNSELIEEKSYKKY